MKECEAAHAIGGERRRARARATAAPHLRFAPLALALGGFAIGTTEFVAMGLLPQIAEGVSISIPTAGHVVSACAIGAWLGGIVLAAGLGLTAPMVVAVALSVAGLAIFLVAPALERRGAGAAVSRP